MQPAPPDDDDGTTTSFHLRRARSGDPESTGWLVERFTPVLMAQASHRLGPRLRTRCDPADVVGDVWAIALPRLESLRAENGHEVAAMLRFLSTTLMHCVNNLARKVIRLRAEFPDSAAPGPAQDKGPTEVIQAETSAVITRVSRSERSDQLVHALSQLDDESRRIVLMRGIEQLPNNVVAERLALPPGTVSHRYLQGLKKLRSLLPNSIFDDLTAS